MEINLFQNSTFNILKKALDGAMLRHEAIAHNIANVDTPGFKRSDVSFKEQLRAAQKQSAIPQVVKTHPKHLRVGQLTLNEVKPRKYVEKNTTVRNDKNNVDIDREMAELSENAIYYNVLSRLISAQYSGLESVIRGQVR